MNRINRILIILLLGSVIGFWATRWCLAQPPRQTVQTAMENNIAIDQLVSFVDYLQATKQTNVLSRFNDYSNVTLASQHSADLAMTLAILQSLREGHTNEAYELLEMRLNSCVLGFFVSYQELSPAIRQKLSLKAIYHARDYRAKFPFKHRNAKIDEKLSEAYKALP